MPHKPKIVIYFTMAIVFLYSLVTSFAWLFTCQPIDKLWDLRITGGSCIEWTDLHIFSGVMNTVSDVIILLLPIVMLQKIQLPKWEKIGLGVVLMTGGVYASSLPENASADL